jgi:hypothetical protein
MGGTVATASVYKNTLLFRDQDSGTCDVQHDPGFADAEVEHLHRAVGAQLDIGRLEVTVDNPLLVGRFERPRDLPRDRQRLVYGNRPLRDALGQCWSLDQLQRERPNPIRFFETVNRRDMG